MDWLWVVYRRGVSFALVVVFILIAQFSNQGFALAGELRSEPSQVQSVSCFLVGRLGHGSSPSSSDTYCSIEFDTGKVVLVRAALFPLVPLLKAGDAVIVTRQVSAGPFPSSELVGVRRNR